MALTIKYNPPIRYNSAHGDNVFVLLEDTKPFNSTTYPDYKYVCDVYIVDVSATETLATRLKSYPMPGTKFGVFDIGSIIRNYLLTNFSPHPTDIFYQKIGVDSFFIQVICRFGEEYNFTTYPNIIIDSQRAYFNNYNGRLTGNPLFLQNYLDKVISNRPYENSVSRTATHNLIPFLASDDTVITCEVKCYNKSLGFIRQQDFTVSPTVSSIDEVLQINIAPVALNFAFPSLVDDIVDYYTVKWSTTNITEDSILKFNLVCEPKYEPFSLHFLNKFGGFESKEFTKVSRKTIETEKSEYRKKNYTIASDGSVNWFAPATLVYNEQLSVYASEWTEKMQINTDIINDSEYAWLKELIISPQVYIGINGYFYSVKIKESNYEEKKIINDRLTNLTLNIDLGEKFNAQYR